MVAFSSRALSRIKRGIQRQGLFPSCRRFVANTFNRIFRARLCVWQWKQGDPLREGTGDMMIERLASADALCGDELNELVAGDGPGFVSRMQEEFSEGGILWFAKVDGRVAGYQWSRKGNFVENWHFDLSERDVLIYSTVTFHEFRGRGVAVAVIARICREEVPENGCAWADCMVWNAPAVRFIEKTGFNKVTERKPLADHPD